MFEQHQLLLPLLVALETEFEQGKITEKEVKYLGKNLGELDAQLDLATDTNTRGSLQAKPKWISDKVRGRWQETAQHVVICILVTCSPGAMHWNSRKKYQHYEGCSWKFLISVMNGKNTLK